MLRSRAKVVSVLALSFGLTLLGLFSTDKVSLQPRPLKCPGNPCGAHEICCLVGCDAVLACIPKESGQGLCPLPPPCPDGPVRN